MTVQAPLYCSWFSGSCCQIQKAKLPTQGGKVWWLEFDVSPKQLNEVILWMMGPDRKKALPPENGRVIAAETLPRKPSSIDEGGGNEIVLRKLTEVRLILTGLDDEIDPEAWIENELENGVELKSTSARRKQRL